MEMVLAAKYIGAGLACFGMAGTALGLSNIFGSYLSGALRNPSAADSQFGRLVFGFAVTEALGIFSLLIALLLLLGFNHYQKGIFVLTMKKDLPF